MGWPLVIMVNSFSASASEILAAANPRIIKRILLVVSKHMVRTVQNVIDLNQFSKK
jgi:carboxyl-terminal processing protease